MHARYLLCLVPLAAACTTSENRSDASLVAPAAPLASVYNDPARVDNVGTPDLIVDKKSTENHWRVKSEIVPADACSAIEGGVTPGDRRLLRFTVTTPNIGDADVFVGSPLAHMDPNGDGAFSDSDGLFEFASCHNHFHFQHYATYKLIDAKTGKLWRSAKRGFCMLDTDPYETAFREGPRNYWSCGTATVDGFQGISKGWSDTYVWKLAGQYFVLDGGDGQPVVPAGDYYIEVEVNPAFAPAKKAACPRVTDPRTGLCHQFKESNYANNTTRILVSIPAAGAAGPEKNAADPTLADEIDHGGR